MPSGLNRWKWHQIKGRGPQNDSNHLSFTDWQQGRLDLRTKHDKIWTKTSCESSLSLFRFYIPKQSISLKHTFHLWTNNIRRSLKPSRIFTSQIKQSESGFYFVLNCLTSGLEKKDSSTCWTSGTIIVFHQCKNVPEGFRQKWPLFASKCNFCQVSQKSHDRGRVRLAAGHRGPMEVAIVSGTPVAYCGFIRLLCSCTWTFYSTKTNSRDKKKINFFTKKEIQWLQYKDRENQQLNSYISLTNYLFLKKYLRFFFSVHSLRTA